MKKLLLLLSVFASTQASAQYVSEGPRGGAARNYCVDAATVWVASSGGVFSSTNNGQSWSKTITPPLTGTCEELLSVAAQGNEIYVGSSFSGVVRSADGGFSWSPAGAGILRGVPYVDLEIAGVNCVAIRGDNGGLLVTTDRGASWSPMNFAIGNATAQSLSVHNNALYVTSSAGLYKSMDNGLTYMNINPSLADIGELSWSHDTVYVASSTGLKMSIDDGVTFTPIGLNGVRLGQVAADGNRVYVSVLTSAQDSLKVSTDGGHSFSNALSPFPFSRVYDLTFINGTALAGTDQSMYRAPSGSLQKSDSGFFATGVNALAANGTSIFAATTNTGIFASSDSAEHWQNVANKPQGVTGVLFSIAAQNQFVHAGGAAGYFRSSNSGAAWTSGATGLATAAVTSVLAVKGSSDVLAIQNGNLFLSRNDGGSFTALSSGVPTASYLVTQADTSIFLASNAGLYKGNSSYSFVATTGTAGAISAVVFYRNNYYASSRSNGLFSSADGITWVPVVPAPGTLPLQINSMAVRDTILYLGSDFGLYSDSMGLWHPDSLVGLNVESLVVSNGKLFAGTCAGVWSLKNLPPPIDTSTGVGQIQRMDYLFTAYPNPVQNELHVSFQAAKSGPAMLSMYDLTGRTIWTRSVALTAGKNDWQLSKEVSSQPAGVYFLQLSSGPVSAQRKIVLQGR